MKGWLYKCDQFFDVDATLEDAKVRLASIYLEGRALQWYQVYMKGRLTKSTLIWEEYVQALSTRFGQELYDDPMAELNGLK